MFSQIVATAVLAFAASVAADPANPTDIALVKQQFVNALLTPTVVPVFDPTALLSVSFGNGSITTGQAIDVSGVASQPNVTVVGTDADFAQGGNLNSSAKYTIIMIDGDIAGSTNPNGVNTHWLQNDLSISSPTADEVTLSSTTAPVIAYAGPGPASGSGPHRYTILLLPQPTSFTAPGTPAAGSSVTMINFPQYLQSAQLGNPIAGNYFTVEVGTATVTPSQTQAVNTASLAVGSTTGGASSGAGASATHSSSTAGSTATKSGAGSLSANGFVAVLAAGACMAFFA